MKALIKKEFLANKQMIMISIIIAAGYFPFMILQYGEEGIVTLSFMWAVIIPFLVYFHDQKMNGLPLTCSLPGTRKKVVGSKYITAWILLISYMLFTILVSYIAVSFTGGNVVNIFEGKNIFTFLRGFFVISLFIGLLYPIALRYGTITGIIIVGISLNILGVITFTITKMLSGTRDSIDDFFRSIYSAVASVSESLLNSFGEPLFVLFVLFLIIAINYASFKTSVILFKKRDL
jgi:ABC-type transport system involved in multi-copper enzyme maturation permease subunit